MEKKEFSESINNQPQHKEITSTTNEEIHDTFGTKLYAISFGVTNKLMDSGEPFALEEVREKIINRGGIARMGMGVTIREYFENLEDERGRAKLNPSTGKYQATEKWPKVA